MSIGAGALASIGDPVPLRTSRLLLRLPLGVDAGSITSLANDIEVARRLGRMPHPYRLVNARFFLDEIVPREWIWAITLEGSFGPPEAAAGEIIGVVGLAPDERGTCAELGYWLGRRFWGLGFATEAATAVVRHAFGVLGLTALTSACFEDNAASARVLHKLGFIATRRGERPCLVVGSMVSSVEMRLERHRPKAG